MAYQTLYRKYRPQRFDELVGQDHVTTALRNAARDGRVGHAYLFSGPRGTGKTTTARVLAKALNCTQPGDDGEPCAVCDNCLAIARGTFPDVFEMDAASNNGIDDVRDLIQRVHLVPTAQAKRKVYIIDEAHMLGGRNRSSPAVSALLKTLEEPPEHVVFILATTEPESMPATIASRTQHFAFTLVPTEQIAGLLGSVLEREGMEFAPEALEAIARAGEGSVRDALSVLDQAVAQGTGTVDLAAVGTLTSHAPFTARAAVLEAIAGEDSATALILLADILDGGQEPRRVAEDLLRAARDAFVLTAGEGRVSVDGPTEEQERLRAVGQALGNAAMVRVIETLGQAVVDMRGVDAADPRLVLEVALVRLSRRDAGPPLQTVIERLERLERTLAGGAPGDIAPPGRKQAPAAPPPRGAPGRTVGAVRAEAQVARAGSGVDAPPEPAPGVDAPGADGPGPDPAPASPTPAPATGASPALDDVILAWADLLPELPPATRAAVATAQPVRVDGDVVVFGMSASQVDVARPRFKREADTIRAALTARLGTTVKFTLVADESAAVAGESHPPGAGAAAAPSRSSPPSSPPAAGDDQPGHQPDDHTDDGDPDALDDPAFFDQAPDASADPLHRLTEQLGATVVEEVPRP